MPAPSTLLHRALLDLLSRSPSADASTIETLVRCFDPRTSWTLRVLNTYLDLYARTEGAAPAWATFRFITDTVGVVPDHESFTNLLMTFAADWRNGSSSDGGSGALHLRHTLQLRTKMERLGVRFTQDDMQRLYNVFHRRRSMRERMQRWAAQDGLVMPVAVVPVQRPPVVPVNARVRKSGLSSSPSRPPRSQAVVKEDVRFLSEQLDTWWSSGDPQAAPSAGSSSAAAQQSDEGDKPSTQSRVRQWLSSWIK
jgi:hypothetical protein